MLLKCYLPRSRLGWLGPTLNGSVTLRGHDIATQDPPLYRSCRERNMQPVQCRADHLQSGAASGARHDRVPVARPATDVDLHPHYAHLRGKRGRSFRRPDSWVPIRGRRPPRSDGCRCRLRPSSCAVSCKGARCQAGKGPGNPARGTSRQDHRRPMWANPHQPHPRTAEDFTDHRVFKARPAAQIEHPGFGEDHLPPATRSCHTR